MKLAREYNPSTRQEQPKWLKRYAELMRNHKKLRIKSRSDNILIKVVRPKELYVIKAHK